MMRDCLYEEREEIKKYYFESWVTLQASCKFSQQFLTIFYICTVTLEKEYSYACHERLLYVYFIRIYLADYTRHLIEI